MDNGDPEFYSKPFPWKREPDPAPGTPESVAKALETAINNYDTPSEDEVAARLVETIKKRYPEPQVFTSAPPPVNEKWNPSRLAMTQQAAEDRAIAEVYFTGKLPSEEKTIPELIEVFTQDTKLQFWALASRILRAVNKEPVLQP